MNKKAEKSLKPVIEIVRSRNRNGQPWDGRGIQMLLPDSRPVEVHVDPKTKWEAEGILVESYEVNWSAFGGVDPDFADQYCFLIRRAAREARKLNKKYAGKLMKY